MSKEFIRDIEEKALLGEDITYDEAKKIIDLNPSLLFELFISANRIKEHFIGNKVHLCSIVNAKSGRCKEDCGFCAQSAHHKTYVPVYDMINSDEMLRAAKNAEKSTSGCFGIVTSGSTIKSDDEFNIILDAVRKIKAETSLSPSASLGMISYEQAVKLKEAGVKKFHHNIETSRNFFPNVCTTHSYDDDLETIRSIKRAGLKICSGVILGLGESQLDWIDMAFTLRELDVDSVPINFLNPIKNTRFENNPKVPALELLRGIALFRFILPTKSISICGGREKNLRDLQSFMFLAGASGTMAGNYLTTKGRSMEDDFKMISDLGLEVER
ncbi:biotin synthase BioB [Thermodesulfobacteriota bacterium]